MERDCVLLAACPHCQKVATASVQMRAQEPGLSHCRRWKRGRSTTTGRRSVRIRRSSRPVPTAASPVRMPRSPCTSSATMSARVRGGKWGLGKDRAEKGQGLKGKRRCGRTCTAPSASRSSGSPRASRGRPTSGTPAAAIRDASDPFPSTSCDSLSFDPTLVVHRSGCCVELTQDLWHVRKMESSTQVKSSPI